MVNSLVQAICLTAAATTIIAMPHDIADDAHAYSSEVQGRSNQKWPLSELIHESPIDFHYRQVEEQQELAMGGGGGGSRTQNLLPPCASETPVGMGDKVTSPGDTSAAFLAYAPFQTTAKNLGVDNSSFLIQSTNSNAAFQFVNNTYLGWINQPMYSPWNCSLACNALNATGIKCNSYNTCEYLVVLDIPLFQECF